MNEQWVLLWSQSENAVRMEPLAEALSNARAAYRDNLPSDYVALYVGDRGHIAAAAGFCQSTLAERTPSPHPMETA